MCIKSLRLPNDSLFTIPSSLPRVYSTWKFGASDKILGADQSSSMLLSGLEQKVLIDIQTLSFPSGTVSCQISEFSGLGSKKLPPTGGNGSLADLVNTYDVTYASPSSE